MSHQSSGPEPGVGCLYLSILLAVGLGAYFVYTNMTREYTNDPTTKYDFCEEISITYKEYQECIK